MSEYRWAAPVLTRATHLVRMLIACFCFVQQWHGNRAPFLSEGCGLQDWSHGCMVSYVGVPLEGTLQVALWCWYCNKVAIAVKYAQVTVRRVSYKVCGGEGGGSTGILPPPSPREI